MSEYYISRISPDDRKTIHRMDQLLEKEGIRRDAHLDYLCGLFDEEENLVATGSCFGNTLRCLAVSSEHQGEGLMNRMVTHLVEIQFERGNTHLFLYTKCDSARFFEQLGFYEIVRIDRRIVFMENRKTGFTRYLQRLKNAAPAAPRVAALVMNANPFTLGHQYLVEKAAAENDIVHLFVVSEDQSVIPFSVRKKLVCDGVRHLTNVCCHDTGSYMISNSTFPSYFQRDKEAAIESHAMLDLAIFVRLAQSMQITCRYVGEEPYSLVTAIYNRIMAEELPKKGIDCRIVQRKKAGETFISASHVRQAVKEENFPLLKQLVPETTWRYFLSDEAKPVIQRIQNEDTLIHY